MKYPPHTTLTGRALSLLLQEQRISHRDFQNHSASYCLRADVEILGNKLGWPISRAWFHGPTNDKTGRRARYKRYWLETETIAAAGERGRLFVEAVRDWEARATAIAHAGKTQS